VTLIVGGTRRWTLREPTVDVVNGRIGIVGAGLTGLSLAHELDRLGGTFLLLERGSRVGGVIRTEGLEGVRVEVGPQRMRLTSEVKRVVRELGLEEDLLPVPEGLPLYVFRAGRLREVPFDLRGWISTDLLSWPGKLRMLLQPLEPPPRPRETLAEFFTRKFGWEAYRSLFGPLYGGLHSSDPHRMYARLAPGMGFRGGGKASGKDPARSLLRTLLGRRDGPKTCSFRGGMVRLPEALHARHRDRIRLGTGVRSIRRRESEYVLEARGGEEHRVSRVVLTVPAREAGRLLRDLAPEAAARLCRLRYNRLAVVFLHGACDLEGFGFKVAFGESLRIRGATWNHSLFGQRGLYTAYLGGMHDPEVVNRGDEEIGRIARLEFRRVTGCETRVLGVRRTWVPAWDRSWVALDGATLPPGIHLCGAYTGRPGIPGRLREASGLARRLIG